VAIALAFVILVRALSRSADCGDATTASGGEEWTCNTAANVLMALVAAAILALIGVAVFLLVRKLRARGR